MGGEKLSVKDVLGMSSYFLKQYYKWPINAAGYLVTLGSIYYLITVGLKSNLVSLQTSGRGNLLFVVPSSLMVYLLLLLLGSYTWELILEFISGDKIPTKVILPIFTQSNIAKYFPGNVLQYVSRNFLGKKLGWKHSDIGLSSLVEIVLGIGIFAIVLVLMLWANFITIPRDLQWRLTSAKSAILIIAGGIVCLIAVAMSFFWKKETFVQKAKLFISKDFVFLFAKVFALYCIVFVGSGLILAVILYSICTIDFALRDYVLIISVFTFSAFAGYIVPGAPGGIGVRESILVLMLSPAYGEANTLMASIIHRLVSVGADLLAFALGWVVSITSAIEKKR